MFFSSFKDTPDIKKSQIVSSGNPDICVYVYPIRLPKYQETQPSTSHCPQTLSNYGHHQHLVDILTLLYASQPSKIRVTAKQSSNKYSYPQMYHLAYITKVNQK